MRSMDAALPLWALTILFVGGTAAISMTGFWVFHRSGLRSPDAMMDTMVSAFSGKATALFGILLVFVIVSEFNHFNAAQNTADQEATALAQIVRDTRVFPAADQESVNDAVRGYVRAVTTSEWKSLSDDGAESPAALDALARLQHTVQDLAPHGTRQATYYAKLADEQEILVNARRDRLDAASAAIPNVLLYLLFAGAVVFLVTMLSFSAGADRVLLLMMLSLGALTGAGLLITVVLDFAFSGTIGVSTEAYHTGALARLVGP